MEPPSPESALDALKSWPPNVRSWGVCLSLSPVHLHLARLAGARNSNSPHISSPSSPTLLLGRRWFHHCQSWKQSCSVLSLPRTSARPAHARDSYHQNMTLFRHHCMDQTNASANTPDCPTTCQTLYSRTVPAKLHLQEQS